MLKYVIFATVLLIVTESNHIPQSINELAIKLHVVLPQTNGNVLFSPLSAHIALILCHQGSSGITRKILQDVLILPSDQLDIAREYKAILRNFNDTRNDLSFSVANSIYLKTNYNLKSQFQEIAGEYFGANIENVDFTKSSLIAKQINDWISERTKHKIQDVIVESALTEETRVVLVNAVYFKGSWAHPFKMHETQKDKFYISDLQTVDCQMMQTTGDFYYSDSEELDAKILKIPYVDRDIFFVVILPNSVRSLKKIETKLIAKKNLISLVSNMDLENVEVLLPKFKLETNIDLRQPLEDIGLGNIFSEKANFSQMLNSHEPLTISKVLQKTFIDINENGTEAASATSVLIRMRRSLNLHQYKFYANKPFIFYIMDSASSVLLFLGKLMNPNPTDVHDEL
ncbi:hypothetical protein Trydic_g12117 [Trypoxylus dichotomus]